MRPACLEPKLSDADRLDIRRLRGEDRKRWTLNKLAARFGVHRSTISLVLKKPLHMAPAAIAGYFLQNGDVAGTLDRDTTMRAKHAQWLRELLAETNLNRQGDLLNLIRQIEQIEPILKNTKPEPEKEPETPAGPSSARLVAAADEQRALEALRGQERDELAANRGALLRILRTRGASDQTRDRGLAAA